MRIGSIEVIELRVPGWAGDSFDGSRDDCLLRLRTDDGLEGIAEVDSVPSVIRAIIEAPRSHIHAMGLTHVLVGADPSDPPALWQKMYDATSYHGRRGAVIHAISGVDIALWDLKGKAEGRHLSHLLGTRRRDRLLAYGTIYPLGETPDEARRALDRGLAMGFRGLKICADRWWRDRPDVAAEIIHASRRHVGGEIRLMIDCATAWDTAEDGLPFMPLFREHGFGWVEAPLPIDDLAGHARFQGFGVPIAAGDLGLTTRYDFEMMFDIGHCDIAQPDISMAGGFTEFRRIAALARDRGRRLVPHGYKTNLTIAANLAFLAQHEDEEMLEYSTSTSPIRLGLTRESIPIEADGRVSVPGGPGLGVTLDETVVAAFRIG